VPLLRNGARYDQSYYYVGLIGSCIGAFDWHHANISTLDDLERLKRPLVEVNKNSGAQQKNFNEGRPISLRENVGCCIYLL